ncbi:MAG: DUF2800 domain-containing protein, partial [Deltaproteobacteria bacterium]|nr:DUF2800 domain-containing protein [Deltaproteobacteria bacterium]
MSHAELAPSGSKRWLNCPGSVIRLREFPVQDKSNPAAILGTHIHTLSEFKLRGEIEELLDEIGETYSDHEGDFEVTLEMVEAAEYYCAYVYEVLGEDATMWIEKKVVLFYHIDDTGTADVVAIVGDTLHVIDLKTGFFKVFAHGNTQLRIYAGSAYEELIEYYDIEHVHCHIVMTKHKETSDECIPVEELTAFMSYVTDVVEVIDNDPTNAKCIA